MLSVEGKALEGEAMDNERAALVEARRRATEAAEADLPTFVRRGYDRRPEGSVKAPSGLTLSGPLLFFRRTLGPRTFEGTEVALIAALAFCAGVLTHAVAWAVLR